MYSFSGSLLAVGAQADALAQMVEVEQVVLPVLVEDLHQHALLDLAHDVGPVLRGLLREHALDGVVQALADLLVGDAFFLGPVVDRQVEAEDALHLVLQSPIFHCSA